MITNLATVKLTADTYTILGMGSPEITDAGEVGDIWLDFDPESATFGKSYELTEIDGSDYIWAIDESQDVKIGVYIARAEDDYLEIRGVPFEESEGATVYPKGSESTAAEMVCYLMGLGDFDGRGKESEGLAGRSASYDKKLHGYPVGIIGTVKRFHKLS